MLSHIIVILWCVAIYIPIARMRDQIGRAVVLNTKHLVLSGGSMRGFAHMGCINDIVRVYPDFLNQLNMISFSSAGCVAGLCCAFNFLDLERWVSTYDLTKVLADTNVERLFDRVIGWTEWGIKKFGGKRNNDFFADDGIGLRLFIRTLIKYVSGLYMPTLKELNDAIYKIRNKEITLVIYATNMDVRKCDAITHLTHPAVLVEDAFMATMAIPFLFPPVYINDVMYVDGGAIMNVPTPKFHIDEMLYLRLRTNICYCNNFRNNALEYVYRLFEVLFDGQLESLFHYSPEVIRRIISIECDAGGLSDYAKTGIGNIHAIFDSGTQAFRAYCLSPLIITLISAKMWNKDHFC